MDKEAILEELESINAKVTPEVLKNATKEEILEYINLSSDIIRKMEILNF